MKFPVAALLFGLAAASSSVAQAPPAAPTPPALAVPAPNYITIPMEIDVNRPAADVWKRIGKFCDIGEWLPVPSGCHMLSGKEADVGSVRSVGNEVLVGKTELSYAYTQPVYEGRPYNLYHGFLEARPLTPTTTKIIYTLMYDNSLVPGDAAAKAAEIQGRRTRFERALRNMKVLAEGGSLPPPPQPPR
jgi:hypothetical protein